MKAYIYLMAIMLLAIPIMGVETNFETSANVTISNQSVTLFIEGNSFGYSCGTNNNHTNIYNIKRDVNKNDFTTINVGDLDNLTTQCELIAKQYERTLDHMYNFLNYSERYNLCSNSKAVLEEELRNIPDIEEVLDEERIQVGELEDELQECQDEISFMVLPSEYDSAKNQLYYYLVAGAIIGFFGRPYWDKRNQQKKGGRESTESEIEDRLED